MNREHYRNIGRADKPVTDTMTSQLSKLDVEDPQLDCGIGQMGKIVPRRSKGGATGLLQRVDGDKAVSD